jgi:hypothetical protein
MAVMHTYSEQPQDYGCPLRFQTGPVGVKNFEQLIEQLPPDERAAFEAERDERQRELDRYVDAYGYAT